LAFASALAPELHFERHVASLPQRTMHWMMSSQPVAALQSLASLEHVLSAHDKHAWTSTPPPLASPSKPVLFRLTQTRLRQSSPSLQVAFA
jgi:hypothetical protein